MTNITFTRVVCSMGALAIVLLWLWTLLLTSGDVHPNPGASSMSSNSSSSNFSNSSNDSFSFLNTLNLSKHFSFIHYNVQSIANKLDILTAELPDFDIRAFSETWLHAALQTADLLMPNFKPPERKYSARDNHWGVKIYVKDSVHYTRRNAGKGLTSWLSFVVSYCEFVTFPLVSWVRWGTWLYRFLISAPLLTLEPLKLSAYV